LPDAVRLQPDMELVGVVKVTPDYKARQAIARGIGLYCTDGQACEKFERAGIKTVGTLDDLLEKVDVIVDCTPGMWEKPTGKDMGSSV
jgi:glyceraldehyde-3-phosphate dehydrogenase (NAD(P))